MVLSVVPMVLSVVDEPGEVVDADLLLLHLVVLTVVDGGVSVVLPVVGVVPSVEVELEEDTTVVGVVSSSSLQSSKAMLFRLVVVDPTVVETLEGREGLDPTVEDPVVPVDPLTVEPGVTDVPVVSLVAVVPVVDVAVEPVL